MKPFRFSLFPFSPFPFSFVLFFLCFPLLRSIHVCFLLFYALIELIQVVSFLTLL